MSLSAEAVCKRREAPLRRIRTHWSFPATDAVQYAQLRMCGFSSFREAHSSRTHNRISYRSAGQLLDMHDVPTTMMSE
jgi:hypothetical protein